MENKQKALHEQVAEKVIEGLRAGTAPWQQPWDSSNIPLILPYNTLTGKRYRGINSISLLMAGRDDPRWMTFLQAEDSGYKIRKGERASLIQFVKTTDEKLQRDSQGKVQMDELGQPIKVQYVLPKAIVRNAWVFNADQIDGIPRLELPTKGQSEWTPIEKAEKLIASSGAIINHSYSRRAFYDMAKDQITLPYKNTFSESSRYYATVLHEIGHWTGHENRLNRDMGSSFGDLGYAREELRAEIASMIMGQEIGIGHDPGQHIAYVESWIKILEDDPFEIFSASMEAEKICNYILDLENKKELSVGIENINSLRLPNARIPDYLSTGDEISYNESVFKVLGHLKQGRLKMEEVTTGNMFTLSKEDKLYSALLYVKREMTASQKEENKMATNELPFTGLNR